MVYKTPGVYVKEVSLFPPSVAQVETAIPAFAGYTQKAVDASGRSLSCVPARVGSLVEFQSLFGGAYLPESYRVVLDSNATESIAPGKRFRLFDALRQFYDNGGGYCHIVSVGTFDDTITFDALKKGFDLIAKVDEPTLLLCPDAVELKDSDDEPDIDSFATLQKEMLNQCAGLQDRFSILDILEGELAEDVTNKPLSGFRDTIGINNLSYGAAYYPWIVTSYGYDLSFRQLHLYDKEEPETEIKSFDSLSGNDSDKKLVTSVTQAIADTDALLAIGDASLKADELRHQGSELLKEQLSKYHEAIAVAADPASSMTSWLNLLGRVAVAFGNAESKAAGAELVKVIKSIKEDDKLLEALMILVAVEKNPKTVANTESRDAVKVKELYTPLDSGWLGADKFEAVVADGSNFEKSAKGCHEIIKTLSPSVITILNAWQRLLDAALHFEKLAESAVFSTHPFFHGVHEKIIARMRTMPPSGTIAGICASVDRTRGVWKSPANVSLNAVIGPAVRMDNREQEEMNVHTTGKSINAIRAFTGRGTLVWGSRTLAGNDQEWRYVPVRRFFIMVEESTKKATEPFVFEPNDANTWVKVRTMIENFLTLQWRAGALQGSKPDEAFYVRVGLNETMTAQDILEGFLIVEIGLAAVRPAEFIVLRFSHQMQASGG